MPRSPFIAVRPLVLVGVVSLGCGALGDPPPASDEASGDEPDTTAATGSEPDTRTEVEKLHDKLSLHVECLERSAGHIAETWARYAERVGEDGRPRSKKVIPYLYEIDSELEPCERAVNEGPELPPPRPELDQAQKAYLDAAKTFSALTVELHGYYEREGQAEDDWAKSVALAPKMQAAHTAWSTAHDALALRLEAERGKNDVAMLDAIAEREGKDLRWHAHDLRLSAQAFAECAEAGERDPCLGAEKDLEEAYAGFETAHAADPDASRVFWMSSYRATAAELVAKAQAFVGGGATAKKGKPSAASVDDVAVAWTRLDRDFAHLDFDFPR